MMDFRAFVTLAEILASGASEAEWRTSVSRAYYGAFHVACDLLRAMGFEVPKADRAHGYVIYRLSNSGDVDVGEAGASLDELRRSRNRADYEKRRSFGPDDAELSVTISLEVIDTLGDALQEPLRTQITEAIRTYERDVLKDVTWRA